MQYSSTIAKVSISLNKIYATKPKAEWSPRRALFFFSPLLLQRAFAIINETEYERCSDKRAAKPVERQVVEQGRL